MFKGSVLSIISLPLWGLGFLTGAPELMFSEAEEQAFSAYCYGFPIAAAVFIIGRFFVVRLSFPDRPRFMSREVQVQNSFPFFVTAGTCNILLCVFVAGSLASAYRFWVSDLYVDAVFFCSIAFLFVVGYFEVKTVVIRRDHGDVQTAASGEKQVNRGRT